MSKSETKVGDVEKLTKIKPKDKPHYVKNSDFFKAYVDWYKDIIKNQKKKKPGPDPEMPRFIAESILKICTRLAYRPNFLNYSFRDEMIGDAIENCIKVAKNFNPAKSENPFSWHTTVAFNAFLRRIEREKKESMVKAKLIRELPIEELMDMQEHDEDTAQYRNQFIEFLRDNNYIDAGPSDEPKKKKKTIEDDGLELFMEKKS